MFTVTGPVQHGNQEARLLGVPTANLYVAKLESNQLGVYAGYLHTFDSIYPACIYIDLQLKPEDSTCGIDTESLQDATCRVKVEAHCIGFTDLDLYDKIVSVHALYFIRPKMKFASMDECKSQINLDLEDIKKVLQTKTS